MVVVKETFPESTSRTQRHTIEVDKLKEIESVSVDGGEVEIESVEDNLVTLRFRARNWDRRVQTGGSYTPADSKYVTAERSKYYNSGGYSGTLDRYLYSGSYTPEERKFIPGQRGHTGTSGVFPTRDEAKRDLDSILPDNWYYNDGRGFSGYLSRDSVRYLEFTEIDGTGWYVRGEGVYGNEFITIPAVDTRVYRYQGTVRRPARDTRTWDHYYQYTATINYIEKGFEIQTKIDGQLRTANEGWVKINGQLRPIEYIYTKTDGKIVEVD